MAYGIGISPFFARNYSSAIVPPPPPYIRAATNTDIITTISGLSYNEGAGPSQPSIAFRIIASGLIPSSGNILVTPPSNIEIFDGTIWRNTFFTIPYNTGSVSTSLIYKVRLKAGLSPGSITGELVLSGANATDFHLTVSGTVIANPDVVASPTSLSFGNVIVNTISSQQSFVVSGTALVGNLTVSPPSRFLISITNGSGYSSSSIVLVPSGGNVSSNIYVVFNPNVKQAYSDNIVCSSSGAITENVIVSGIGIVPLIIVSGGPLNFSNVPINTNSSEMNYSVEAEDLVADLIITPPSGFQISQTSGSGYTTSPINITPIAGVVSSRSIYVIFSPTLVQSYNGNITHISTSATSKNISVSGNGVQPTISVSPSSLTYADTTINTQSSQQFFDVTFSNLNNNLIITPPAGFNISTTNGSGYSNSPINLGTGSNIIRIYVVFVPTIVQSYSGNISCVSTGATTQNVSVSGNGLAAFQQQTIDWMTVQAIPNDGTVYNASTIYQITGAQYWTAVNNFFLNLKGIGSITNPDNLLPKILGAYLPIGNDGTAIRFNMVNPADTDGAYRLTLITLGSAGVLSGIGLTVTSGYYGNTHFVPNTIPANSIHIGAYVPFNGAAGYLMGTFQFGGYMYIRRADTVGTTSDNNCSTVGNSGIATDDGSAFLINNRIMAGIWRRYNNGTPADINVQAVSQSNLEMYLFGLNNNGGPTSSSGAIYKYLSFGFGFTDSQALVYSQIVTQLQTDLLRP